MKKIIMVVLLAVLCVGCEEKENQVIENSVYLEVNYIGEVFMQDNVYVDLSHKWTKFTKKDIMDEVDGYIKIKIRYEPEFDIDDFKVWTKNGVVTFPGVEYFTYWYDKKDIIWYADIYKAQKAVIEQRIKAKEKTK